MMRKVAILQSNYIPWKGYFDIINDVDLFIFYDDVQYTKNDWRNRNKIVTINGIKWITIAAESNKISQKIIDVKFKEPRWNIKQWETIKQFYKNTPFFKQYKEFFEHIYIDTKFELLSEFNQFLIRKISTDILRIDTEFQDSRIYNASGQKTDRLIEILKKANANLYVSGPAAKNYIEDNKFKENNIEIVYKNYTGYPEYPQSFSEFNHFVTILDLIFNVGPDAPYYIWGWRGK
jgi:hypothetical protein